jgi:predicted RNase H-like HicB family nuclease
MPVEIAGIGGTIMLTEYIGGAMHEATYELLPEDEGYYGEIPALPGVWADGPTLELCRENLRQALEGWVLLGLRLGHPLPVIAGVDLNAPLVTETV